MTYEKLGIMLLFFLSKFSVERITYYQIGIDRLIECCILAGKFNKHIIVFLQLHIEISRLGEKIAVSDLCMQI